MLKDDYLQVKLPKDLKNKFFERAKGTAQNPSALVRKWIDEYVKEEEE